MQLARVGVALTGVAFMLSLAQVSPPAIHAQTGTVTGLVWNDLNADGVRDPDEPGLAGWELRLCQGTSCDVRQETISDAAGEYAFTEISPGKAAVCLTLEPHWIATAASGTAIYCPSPSVGSIERIAQQLQIPDGGQVEAQFGLAERNAAMTAQATCPPFVVLGSTIKCSLSFANFGDTSMAAVRADVPLGECGTLGPDLNRCVYGPLGGGYGLQLESSDPAWTGTDFQYGYPYWDPLVSQDMQPGDRVAVSLTLKAISLDQPEQIICPSLGGYPAFREFVSPFIVYSMPDPCVHVTIVTSLPLIGDVNCDGVVNSLDALLLLQLISGLVQALPCPDAADTNGDTVANAVDASLILQFEAGLISGFL